MRPECRFKGRNGSCDPASLVLYGRCQASSRPQARSRKGESRRTLSEPFSPFESKPLPTPIEPSKTSTFDNSAARIEYFRITTLHLLFFNSCNTSTSMDLSDSSPSLKAFARELTSLMTRSSLCSCLTLYILRSDRKSTRLNSSH